MEMFCFFKEKKRSSHLVAFLGLIFAAFHCVRTIGMYISHISVIWFSTRFTSSWSSCSVECEKDYFRPELTTRYKKYTSVDR